MFLFNVVAISKFVKAEIGLEIHLGQWNQFWAHLTEMFLKEFFNRKKAKVDLDFSKANQYVHVSATSYEPQICKFFAIDLKF